MFLTLRYNIPTECFSYKRSAHRRDLYHNIGLPIHRCCHFCHYVGLYWDCAASSRERERQTFIWRAIYTVHSWRFNVFYKSKKNYIYILYQRYKFISNHVYKTYYGWEFKWTQYFVFITGNTIFIFWPSVSSNSRDFCWPCSIIRSIFSIKQ